ncbi:MAG: hypothetical protein RL685_7481 [Pseudomonadota bacterium]
MQRAPGSERGRSSSRVRVSLARISQREVSLRGLTASGLLLLAACGGADVAQTEGSASLEAVLSIDRIEDAAHGEASAASAMAQFVILPSDADVHDTLSAAGLRSQLPERSGCVDQAEAALRANRTGFALREPLELLEAGEVSIQVGEMLTRLALNSFPPSGSASGVIYTTPDQSAAPLPADENYAIRATGAGNIPPISIAGRAPGMLADITVGGVPLERAPQLVAGQPLDLTWAEGSVGDRVVVELTDGETNLFCAFPDEDGSGSLPGSLTAQLRPEPSTGTVRLSVRRIREAMQAQSDAADPTLEYGRDGLSLATTVRFDFEVTALLRAQ